MSNQNLSVNEALVKAMDALREARNIYDEQVQRIETLERELRETKQELDTLKQEVSKDRQTLDSHGQVIEGHGQVIEGHRQTLDSHKQRLDSHEHSLGIHWTNIDSHHRQLDTPVLKEFIARVEFKVRNDNYAFFIFPNIHAWDIYAGGHFFSGHGFISKTPNPLF